MSDDWVLPEEEQPSRAAPSGRQGRAAQPGRPARAATVASADDPWVLPDHDDDHASAPAPGWTLPDEPAAANAISTGPSGLLLGEAPGGQGAVSGPVGTGRSEASSVTIRLFRSAPTRLVLAVPEYVTWLVAYRSISLGAHVSIVSATPHRWTPLVQAVQASGGTVDLLDQHSRPPSAGRPYRPSLVIDDADYYDGIGAQLGPWQAVGVVQSVATSAAVFALRSADLALMAPWDQRVAEQARRAYALTPAQVRSCNNLAENEVVVARPRRVMRVAVPPTPTEYQVLFA